MYECGFDFEMLNVQYRMNPAISAFPSSRFYNSKIANGENVCSPQYGNGTGLLQGRPYTFLQVDSGREEQGMGGSYRNASEAHTVVDMVTRLQAIAQQSNPGDRSSWHSADRIRIITFYQAQVALIKRLLRERGLGDKIVCATVDSSQGTEADVVIVSFVRSQVVNGSNGSAGKVDARYAAGFLTDDRRMNVALTRAKYQLVCVGNVRGMSRFTGTDAETLRLLSADAEQREAVQPYPSMRNNDDPSRRNNDTNARLDLFYDPGQKNKRPKYG
jgi:senataxin